ncbi:MAG: aldolase/citrate lyase family protein [Nocardioidaceae bacterium]
MKPNRIRQLLADDKPTIGTHLFMDSPLMVEMIGHTGAVDYVEFLGEYASFNLHSLEEICRAAELHDLGAMIKVDPVPNQFLAQRGVGAGFDSVLFADPRSAEDVRQCVRLLTPETPDDGGLFGVGARRHSLPGYGGTGAYVQAIRDTVTVIMLEKRSAIDQLDEIVQIPGIDMVQWGPADYSMSIGRPGETDNPEVKATERYVIETCQAAGIPARAEIESVDQAKYYLDLGVRHFCIGYDLLIVHDAIKDAGERLRRAVEGA